MFVLLAVCGYHLFGKAVLARSGEERGKGDRPIGEHIPMPRVAAQDVSLRATLEGVNVELLHHFRLHKAEFIFRK